MKTIEIKFEVVENGSRTKEVSVSVSSTGYQAPCQPIIRVKDLKSGFETTTKLPESEYSFLGGYLEKIADFKLDTELVLGLLKKFGSLLGILGRR